MSRKGKNKSPDSRIGPQELVRTAAVPYLRGNGAELHPTRMGLSPRSRYTVPAVCACPLAVALVFGQTVRHGFSNFDDNLYIYDNPQVAHGFTAQGVVLGLYALSFLQLAPADLVLPHAGLPNLRPGSPWRAPPDQCWPARRQFNPSLPGLRKMTGDLWPSTFVATLFAIHPLHVESVAWVAMQGRTRRTVLYADLGRIHGLCPMPVFISPLPAGDGSVCLGLMAKPMLVTLPFGLLLLDYWPLGRIGAAVRQQARRVLLEKLPWLVLTTAYAW